MFGLAIYREMRLALAPSLSHSCPWQSFSKKEQTTSQAAAAVFVISREDIRRSGALNITDLLRMVPGREVA